MIFFGRKKGFATGCFGIIWTLREAQGTKVIRLPVFLTNDLLEFLGKFCSGDEELSKYIENVFFW